MLIASRRAASELLGDCFLRGDGRAVDYGQAVAFYRLAGQRGLPISYCALGNMYLTGQGVPQDSAKAVELCRKSANLGVANAQTDLGQMYLTGNGVTRDFATAASWFQKASDQGQVNASYLLGVQYSRGDGVARDVDHAMELWRTAALGGNHPAPGALFRIYLQKSADVGYLQMSAEGTLEQLPADSSLRKSVDQTAAMKAVFWGTVATHMEGDPAARARILGLLNALKNLPESAGFVGEAQKFLSSRQVPPV